MGAFVSNKTLAHVFRILTKADANVGQIPQNQFGLLNFINITGSDAQKQFIYKFLQVNALQMVDLKKFQRYQSHSNHVNVGKWAILFKWRKVLLDWNQLCRLVSDSCYIQMVTVLAIVDRHAEVLK
jgi:hypothetical protein